MRGAAPPQPQQPAVAGTILADRKPMRRGDPYNPPGRPRPPQGASPSRLASGRRPRAATAHTPCSLRSPANSPWIHHYRVSRGGSKIPQEGGEAVGRESRAGGKYPRKRGVFPRACPRIDGGSASRKRTKKGRPAGRVFAGAFFQSRGYDYQYRGIRLSII